MEYYTVEENHSSTPSTWTVHWCTSRAFAILAPTKFDSSKPNWIFTRKLKFRAHGKCVRPTSMVTITGEHGKRLKHQHEDLKWFGLTVGKFCSTRQIQSLVSHKSTSGTLDIPPQGFQVMMKRQFYTCGQLQKLVSHRSTMESLEILTRDAGAVNQVSRRPIPPPAGGQESRATRPRRKAREMRLSCALLMNPSGVATPS